MLEKTSKKEAAANINLLHCVSLCTTVSHYALLCITEITATITDLGIKDLANCICHRPLTN